MLSSVSEELRFSNWRQALDVHAQSEATWLIRPVDPVAGSQAQRISYAELKEFAYHISGVLYRAGVFPGQRVALALDNGPEFALSYFGVTLLGAVPVPFPPPYAFPSPGAYQERLGQVLAHSGARCLVADQECSSQFGEAIPRGLTVLPFEALKNMPSVAARYLPAAADQEDTALIQYTSGTTGAPRAVELTQGNVLHNVNGIISRIDPDRVDVACTWLPMFHDMGLVGSLLTSTYSGVPLVMMTPKEFVLRPESWLWAMHRYEATICAAPNFAYKLCANRIADQKVEGLDLRSWTAALTGAENVDSRVGARFTERFSRYGLPRSALTPVYGLAEDVVACTFSERSQCAQYDVIARGSKVTDRTAAAARSDEEGSRTVASLGTPLPGQSVRIRTAFGVGGERDCGEIEIAGPCVMRGYYRDPDKTRAAMPDGEWLRSGDEGYISGGRLHVLGRLCDVIKRAGNRYDAADIAAASQQVPAARGRVAVFGAFNERKGTEDVVVLVESSVAPEQRADVEQNIRQSIRQSIGLLPDVVRTVEAGSIPRTSSGKINNQLAKRGFLSSQPS